MRPVTLFLLAICLSGKVFCQNISETATGHFYSSFDGTRIFYLTAGTGRPVVLVHGFTGSSENWIQIPLYHILIQSGFRLIIPDLRGNGKSDKPHAGSAYQGDAEARDIMGIISQIGLSHYSAVGYSRGSIIVSRLLVLDPRVKRAVMGGMGTGFTDTAWSRRKMFYRALSGDSVAELADLIRYVQKAGLDQRALALQQYGQPSTSRAELASIHKPVLVICGDVDVDNGSGQDLAKLLPEGSFMMIPGDHPHAMHSAEFSADVAAFLEKQ
jgi:pimeloyl-ACP methyl ester carboxylesterase